ncbi:MAG: hypothetical protein IKD08_00025 [Alphaproteobacteria bacterium]|nr:hypothetical protein [Alphaproteobacteria bacterium]
MIIQEKQYVVMTDKENRVIVCISQKDLEPEQPMILYDGGQHAMFYRRRGQTVMLDYINQEMQQKVYEAPQVIVVELKNPKEAVRTYVVPIKKVQKLPMENIDLITPEDIIAELERTGKKPEDLLKKE